MKKKISKKIKIYSTPACVYCKKAKEFFQENKIEFEEYDVSKDERARDEMVLKSEQIGVPVIDINGTIIIGFDKPAIEEALGLKK